jgi:hypothetical protein
LQQRKYLAFEVYMRFMNSLSLSARPSFRQCMVAAVIPLLCACALTAGAQQTIDPVSLYQQLRGFQLSDEGIFLENAVLKRDRMEFTFNGQLLPAQKINGRIHGAVFTGTGRVKVEPGNDFERGSVQRFLKKPQVDVGFKTAVLRFHDDTYEQLSNQGVAKRQPVENAQRLAAALDARIARETGMNLSSVLTTAVSSGQDAGFFFGEFDGGDIGRFCTLFDAYMRSLSAFFGINGGEKGLLFQYRNATVGLDTWTAFYSEQDLQNRRVMYSDAFDLVDIAEYRMDIDLRKAGNWLRGTMELDLVARQDGVRTVPFSMNEGLGEDYDTRLKKGVRVLGASLADGTSLPVIQDPWESGFTVVVPRTLAKEEKAAIKLQLEGEDTLRTWESAFHYPLSTTTWYPRHSYLRPSRFKLTFRHKNKTKVISIGERIKEEFAGEYAVTEWHSQEPLVIASFAVGPFERHAEAVTVAGRSIPIEFYSAPGAIAVIKEDFLLAEMINTVNFFSALFGEYPYKRLGAVFFPANFGQGLPTMLLLPASGRANLHDFAFIAHETAHQWWGDLVSWRSYRDQWLSEGFAQYSGALYAAVRKTPKEALQLVKQMREVLELSPRTETGLGSGKLHQIGPLILGHRLSSTRSKGGYQMVYDKGALVLRMLHFLLTDPSTGDDKPFYDMMKDFVQRHRNDWASTESFLAVASEHFARSPLGKKYGLKDLDWFAKQWVYDTGMPALRLEYKTVAAEGGFVLSGTVYQDGASQNWFMPVPLVLEFDGNKVARGTIHAFGPSTPLKIPMPTKPKRVRLDPDRWVLSDKTSEEGK